MTSKEVQDLLKLISRLELAEFKMKEGDFKLSVRTKHYKPKSSSEVISVPMATSPAIAAPSAPAAPTPVAAPAAAVPDLKPSNTPAEEDDSKYVPIKSPMVGTFYRSSSPDKPAYAKIGDTIASGDTVCIIEAMKLFNEVDAEVSGKIVKVLVEDAQPVEYDQVLFLIDPQG